MTDIPSPVIEEGVAVAKARTAAARGRLITSLLRLKDSVMPGALARRLVDAATQKGVAVVKSGADQARARPSWLAGGIALAALFLARKPIARAISGGKDATRPVRTRSPAKRPRKGRS